MNNIFKNIRLYGDKIDTKLLNEKLNDIPSSILEIESEMERMKFRFEEHDIHVFFEYYNLFSSKSEITEFLLRRLFEFYLDKSTSIINSSYYYGLHLLIDLFGNNLNFDEVEVIEKEAFVEKTFPILFISSEPGSFLEISCLRFISLLASGKLPTGKAYINKLIKESIDTKYKRYLDRL